MSQHLGLAGLHPLHQTPAACPGPLELVGWGVELDGQGYDIWCVYMYVCIYMTYIMYCACVYIYIYNMIGVYDMMRYDET